MRTTAIRYRRLESHKHGFGHDAVEVEAQLEPGEDAEAAFLALRKQVLARLGHIADLHLLTETIDRLRDRRDRLQQTLLAQKSIIDANRKLIAAHEALGELAIERGIELDAAHQLADDGVPF